MARKIKAFVFDAYGTLYDVHSVEQAVELQYPGYGGLIMDIWRMKQLEYSWLTSLMENYEDFWHLTKRALGYALRVLHLDADAQRVEQIAAFYLDLKPYVDADHCLSQLSKYQRAILSNGSQSMLAALIENSNFSNFFDRILSVDAKRVFKPAPGAYRLVEEELGVNRGDVVFVSSNGFDVCGAKRFGFTVVQVKRTGDPVAEKALRRDLKQHDFFNLLRAQTEALEERADMTVNSLAEIPGLFAKENDASIPFF